MANSVDPDQTAPIGSTLFASILNSSLMLGNYLQQTTSSDDICRCIFLSALRVNLKTFGPAYDTYGICLNQWELPRPIPRNSFESDHGCISRNYLNNKCDNMTMTLCSVKLTSQKPC